jgi:hypothetical protein
MSSSSRQIPQEVIMQKILLWLAIAGQMTMTSTANRFEHQHPVPPGVREADKQMNASVETPAPAKRKPVDPARLRGEAEELAKLSAAIPSQIEQINHGQISKDLGEQLKHIEKLAKQLRSEILP